MRYRVLSVALVLVISLSLIVSAQTRNSSTGPRTQDPVAPVRPMAATVARATATTAVSDGTSFPHPDEIQAKLKLLADQLGEAGLTDEARSLAIFEQRLRSQHYNRLMAAYQKSLQNQISLKVQIVDVGESADMTPLFPSMPKDTNPAAGRTVSGVFPPEMLDKWIREMEGQGHVRLMSKQQMTTRDGRIAIFQNSKEPAPTPTLRGPDQAAVQDARFPGLDLAVGGKMDRDRIIRLNVNAQLAPTVESTLRMQTEVDVREGQSLVLVGLRRHGARTEVSRVPVLGDLPGVGPRLFSSKKMYQTTEDLMIVITPETMTAVPGAEVQPAAHSRPAK